MSEPITFREFEHSGWQAVAAGYHDHFASLTSQTIEPLIHVLAIEPEMRVLDVASGPGYVAAEMAHRNARVTAIDFSSRMVERARELYRNIEFLEGDAEDLAFPDRTFDAVSMNFGILHLDRPEVAIHEAYRVLKNNGRFAFSVWCRPDEAKGFGIMLDTIEKSGNPSVELPVGPPFFRFSNPEESIESMKKAGFEHPLTSKVSMRWVLDSVDRFFDAFYKGTPRTGGILRAQSAESLASIKSELKHGLAPYMVNDRLEIPMAALIVCGSKV